MIGIFDAVLEVVMFLAEIVVPCLFDVSFDDIHCHNKISKINRYIIIVVSILINIMDNSVEKAKFGYLKRCVYFIYMWSLVYLKADHRSRSDELNLVKGYCYRRLQWNIFENGGALSVDCTTVAKHVWLEMWTTFLGYRPMPISLKGTYSVYTFWCWNVYFVPLLWRLHALMFKYTLFFSYCSKSFHLVGCEMSRP